MVNYLKGIGSSLAFGGLIGTVVTLASGYNPSIGAGFALSGMCIRECTKPNKTIGNYLGLAGMAILAIGSFDIRDINIGTQIMGSAALVSGVLSDITERRHYSKREKGISLEDQLHQ